MRVGKHFLPVILFSSSRLDWCALLHTGHRCVLQDEINNRLGVFQTVRVMFHARFGNHLHWPFHLTVTAVHQHGVLAKRHHLVCIATHMQNRYFCICHRLQIVNRIFGIVQSLLLREPISLKAFLPITRRCLASPLAQRPTLEVTHWRIVINACHPVRMPRRPVQREQTPSAKSFQHHLFRKPALLGDLVVKSVHRIQRFGGPI